MQHAHGALVAHADIKPSNVLVEADGDPKLLAFGSAVLAEDERCRQPSDTRPAGCSRAGARPAGPCGATRRSLTLATALPPPGAAR